MDAASHMSLRERKAFALQATFVRAVRSGANDLPAEDLAALSEIVGRLATRECEASPLGVQIPLDEFLVHAAKRAKAILSQEVGHVEAVPRGSLKILGEMSRLAKLVNCAVCANGQICSGQDYDDAIVESGGHCISEVKSAAKWALALTNRAYSRVAAPPFPRIILDTAAVDEPPSRIPVAGLAVNGNTQFEDTEESKISRIEIKVALTFLNRVSIGALLYLILHEVFCHEYQMMQRADIRPNQGAVPDPVSEGMVDKVAFDFLVRTYETENCAGPAKADIEIARLLYLARGNLDLWPAFPHSIYVRFGASAAQGIEDLYSQDGDAAVAQADVLALVCSLNVAAWDFPSRFNGLSRLMKGLNAPRDAVLIEHLLNFRQTRDVGELVNYLTKN